MKLNRWPFGFRTTDKIKIRIISLLDRFFQLPAASLTL